MTPDKRVERVLATRGWVVSEGNSHTRTWEREDGYHVAGIPLRESEVGYRELITKAVSTICDVLGVAVAAKALDVSTGQELTPETITAALFDASTDTAPTASIG